MFYLVKFGDNSSGIYNGKYLVHQNDQKCIIKHRGSKYEAQIIHSSCSRKDLEDLKTESVMNNQNYDDNRYDFSVHEKYHNSTSVEKNIVDKNDSNGHNLSDFNISVDTTKSDNFVEKPSSDGESTYESINDRSNANETFTISFDALSGESIELTNGNISFSYEDLSLNHIGNVIDCSEGISHMEQQLLAKERNTATTNDPETESTLFLCEDLNPIQNLTFIASSEDISNLHPVPAPEGSIPQAATTNDSSTFSGSQLTVFVESPSHDPLNTDTDDTQNDPDYDSRNENQEGNSMEDFSTEAPAEPSMELISASPNITGLNPCDDSLLHVNKSCGRNGDKKGNFCIFCHKKQMKISRHFEVRHKNEEDVQMFLSYPKKSVKRRKMIELLRKRGNYLFNSDKNYNDGELIVSRRPNEKHNRTAKDFRACGNCKAYFSKNSLRAHFRNCTKKSSKRERLVMLSSKKVMGRIHSKASKRVREELFPPLREDNIVRAIRYDEIVIIYCNKMVDKYKNSRHFEMIRQRIRLVGRFLTTMRNLNTEVTDLTSVYDPKFIDDTSKAINIEAGLDVESNHYRTPTVAFNLGTLLKQIGNILINECIKTHNNDRKVNTENFLHLLGQEVAMGINRTVAESQFQDQRRKQVELPSKEDIKLLHNHLSSKRREALKSLENIFSSESWKILSETTLMSLQLFNRRRAGEIERILIDDFRSHHGIDEFTNGNIFQTLSAESREMAKKYVRFVIRGKLNRNVPVLLDKELLECLNIILKYREEAGVPEKNPYVFGLPSLNKNQPKFLRACNLIRKFSIECGAKNPERLRGTKLRKHMATACISLNLSENDISDLANFMGHRESIHKSFYRQPIVDREILKISKLLEAAQGVDEDESEDSNEEETITESVNISNAIKSGDMETVVSGKISTQTRKRSTSPYGTVRRARWSELEKKAVFMEFRNDINRKKLPSFKEIERVINVNPILRNRSSAQIKTWIHNQFKGNKTIPKYSDSED